ncbi:major facilitator superfamily domain-containing protein [Lasiosphaeria ovina]|uniref:Major facilitator superfamily domain-containing protein n=1 Tax=Lasiosphaeria ovina TaxID=92902 RepID=A0AAE0KMJ2_9PEZI|nr:major facilitator superfamily domain-containing protein [Lasiosphaeria ovina]
MMLHEVPSVESEPGSLPSAPERVAQRTHRSAPQRAPPIELKPHLPRTATTSTPTPKTALPSPALTQSSPAASSPDDVDLEMSRPTTPRAATPTGDGSSTDHPHDGGGVEVDAMLQSITEPYGNRWRMLAVCLMSFCQGMFDSAPGTLIPAIEKHYDIGYMIVSLIFVGNALGFIGAAAFIDVVRERLGRARMLALAQLIVVVGYIPLACTAPFPGVVVAFLVVGFGSSLTLAVGNVFCGSLRNGTAALGLMHGGYGIGGTVGPLIANALVSAARVSWSRYYLLPLGLTLFNAFFSAYVFWGYDADGVQQQPVPLVATQAEGTTTAPSKTPAKRIDLAGMFSAMSSRVVLLGALFIFAYQGAEVSISGWVISFLIETRGGEQGSVGYVTAGFWAGITLGRFLLSAPAHRVGEKRFVYGVVAGAAALELVVWLVPNVVGSAVAVALVGLLLGPVYPCSAAVFMRMMSKHERVSGMSVISAFGSSGGAVAPFTTGILAQAVGPFVLHPIAIALFAGMMGCWYGLPNRPKKTD